MLCKDAKAKLELARYGQVNRGERLHIVQILPEHVFTVVSRDGGKAIRHNIL